MLSYLFPSRSSVARFSHFCMTDGNSPWKLCFARFSHSREKIWFLAVGSLPTKAFLDRSINFRCCKFHQQLGTSPERLLFDRSRIRREVYEQKVGGSVPLKWLSETSTTVRLEWTPNTCDMLPEPRKVVLPQPKVYQIWTVFYAWWQFAWQAIVV